MLLIQSQDYGQAVGERLGGRSGYSKLQPLTRAVAGPIFRNQANLGLPLVS